MERDQLIGALIRVSRRDERVVGMLDYGSGGRGNADAWSDVDAALFIRDRDYSDFVSDWKSWISQWGDVLFCYVGRFGHWAMFDRSPIALRADFDFIRESEIAEIGGWPIAPIRAEGAVLYDESGEIAATIQRIVGQRDQPQDLNQTFEQVVGDLFYFILFCLSKVGRGESWVARIVFHSQVLDNLVLLLRLEAGAVDRWEGAHAAWNIESVLSKDRLVSLDRCIPTQGSAGLIAAIEAVLLLGKDVIHALSSEQGWPYPDLLVQRTESAISHLSVLKPAHDV